MAPQMNDRREFLRFLGAAAGAAGLCHFRFLNVGMAAGLTAPDQGCQPPMEPDLCNPGAGDPDQCIPPDDVDYGCPAPNQDDCLPLQGDPDLCSPLWNPDQCEPPYNDPDECWNTPDDQDICSPDPLNPDRCPEPGGGPGQDICEPNLSEPDECDPFDTPPDALAVTLASFGAQAEAGHVLLTWETVTEVNNLGFNLHRSTMPAAFGNLLVFVPSQAPGSTAGASYTYADRDVSPGNTYYYWLEDVEFGGAGSLHGPVSATIAAPTAVKLNSLSAATAPSRREVSALLVSLLGGMALTAAGLAGRVQADTDEQA
ncbi:MAG TPA: twin-arginine translocation signal domain-containing protein [Anaerolineae bacterium]|nr:twin-arginine translocation signal domain-containing protein [Anaerolineae bacterium]